MQEFCMTQSQAKRTKSILYYLNLAMTAVFCLPPLLFATFRDMYGISYTLLGTLVLINFCTQLGVDLLFSFFSTHFDLHKTVKLMPLVTTAGLIIYALVPLFFPQYAVWGLVVGTVIFSVAAGLDEVLVSPTVAALPSDTPEKDMSTLHSLYGYGFVGVVVVSTLFLEFVGREWWMYLTLFWAALPVLASILLMTAKLPEMNIEQNQTTAQKPKGRRKALTLCVACIFLGACAENTMANWISVYAEKALRMPKVWGDLLGMALFAAALALSRTFYAKFGKNIHKTLTFGMVGSAVLYIVVALSKGPMLSLVACVAVGISASMLWPGSLIFMEENIPSVGVAAYALMAAGGDLGSSIAPQAFGMIVDKIAVTNWAQAVGTTVSLDAEQVAFKVGLLLVAIFPLAGYFLLRYMKAYFRKLNI